MFSSSSYSFTVTQFWHSVPQQPPQPATHLSLLEQQEHCFPLHRFVDGAWQLHLMTFRSSSVITGTKEVPYLHPQSFGSKVLSMSIFHSWNWKYTQYIWSIAAYSVGGKLSGFIFTSDEATFIYFIYLR